MNSFFSSTVDLSSNYRDKVQKTFILNVHTLIFYLCGLNKVAFFSPKISTYFIQIIFPRYQLQLPFW